MALAPPCLNASNESIQTLRRYNSKLNRTLVLILVTVALNSVFKVFHLNGTLGKEYDRYYLFFFFF